MISWKRSSATSSSPPGIGGELVLTGSTRRASFHSSVRSIQPKALCPAWRKTSDPSFDPNPGRPEPTSGACPVTKHRQTAWNAEGGFSTFDGLNEVGQRQRPFGLVPSAAKISLTSSSSFSVEDSWNFANSVGRDRELRLR
jgi:hypothetical protein